MPKPPSVDPQTCGSCRYALIVAPGDEAAFCRRFPRVWIVRDETGGWSYPEQALTDTCGEFARKLNS